MSNDMNDDDFKALKQSAVPAPSEAARRRALEAAMLAFDTDQQNARAPAQGNALSQRLRSMFSNLGRNWTMTTRLSYGLGTAAVALLLLPLGYQLYTSTAITPIGAPPVVVAVDADKPAVADAKMAPQEAAKADDALKTETIEAAPLMDAPVVADTEVAIGAAGTAVPAAPLSGTLEPKLLQRTLTSGQPNESVMAEFAPSGEADAMAMPAPMDGAVANTVPSGDAFTSFVESPVKIVKNEPVSTFSIDVDTAAYSYVRRALTDGWVPEPDAVRIEELINYFDYAYPAPTDATTPFKPTVSVYPTPWNGKTEIVQIGIKGYVAPVAEDKASNLVFLIDTSGSMDEPDKLPLLKRAFALLVGQLGANDTISIVTYAGSAGVVLEPTRATEKAKIIGALDNLAAGGSTAGAEGIELAYRLAEQNKVTDGVNRVILATDGDFNVGIDDPEDLKTFIKAKRDNGVFLSVLGFGQGNLGDDTMQALAQNGNGNASYIDSFKEAQKVLVEDAGGTLDTIAKDVKIQVEFNPAVVSEYRLIGYETRALNREDFNNDKVDAGDIGAGTTVTALYEITPVGSGAELNDPLRYGDAETTAAGNGTEIGFLKMRYKLPDGTTSKLIELPIGADLVVKDLSSASEDSRFASAVAAFAQKLKGSNYGEMSWDEIRVLAQGARGADDKGYRAEFMQLIDMAKVLVTPSVTSVTPQ
jgi:Ca-activated chloride channel family protein